MTMLVDTDVLIWHLRGNSKATRRLDALGALNLSVISSDSQHQALLRGG